MAFDFAADTDSMILAGATEAYTLNAGVPNGAQFLYGTAYLQNAIFGIIDSCTLKTTGAAQTIKGSGGVALAHAIIDPGYDASVTILSAKEKGRPAVGQLMGLYVPSRTALAVDGELAFFIMSVNIKWAKEGWRMYDLELSRSEAMFADATDHYSYNVEQDGTLGTLIASDA